MTFDSGCSRPSTRNSREPWRRDADHFHGPTAPRLSALAQHTDFIIGSICTSRARARRIPVSRWTQVGVHQKGLPLVRNNGLGIQRNTGLDLGLVFWNTLESF